MRLLVVGESFRAVTRQGCSVKSYLKSVKDQRTTSSRAEATSADADAFTLLCNQIHVSAKKHRALHPL